MSIATGQTVQWGYNALQATVTGNIDSPDNAELKLEIGKSSVQCPIDFKMYMCKMSGLSTALDIINQETSLITISYIGIQYLKINIIWVFFSILLYCRDNKMLTNITIIEYCTKQSAILNNIKKFSILIRAFLCT